MNTRRRWILAIAAASVLVAAMDTYVIVLALPAIMARRRHRHRPAPGGDPDRQRLPARLRRGHAAARPALGSLRPPATAAALPRGLRGRVAGHGIGDRSRLGGGGPGAAGPRRRRPGPGDARPSSPTSGHPHAAACPSASSAACRSSEACSARSTAGLILTVATWQTIFWLNLPIAAAARDSRSCSPWSERSPDPAARTIAQPGSASLSTAVSIASRRAVLALRAGCLSIAAPSALRRQRHDRPRIHGASGGLVWLTPIALAAAGCRGRRSSSGSSAVIDPPSALIPVRRLPYMAGAVDWPGAVAARHHALDDHRQLLRRGPVDRRRSRRRRSGCCRSAPLLSCVLRAQGAARARIRSSRPPSFVSAAPTARC